MNPVALISPGSLTKFEFSRRSTFRLKLRHFYAGKKYENLSEFRIVPIIYDYDCL